MEPILVNIELNIKQLLFVYIDLIKDLLNDKFEITQ
jgi:hypothetical protein